MDDGNSDYTISYGIRNVTPVTSMRKRALRFQRNGIIRLSSQFQFAGRLATLNFRQCLLGIHPAFRAGMKHFVWLFALLVSVMCRENTSAASVELDWAASTSPDVAGYDVYFGTSSGNFPNKIDVGTSTTVTIPNLTPGVTYYFAATAYDPTGSESVYSGQISYVAPTTPAGPAVTLTPGTNPGDPVTLQFTVVAGSWCEVQASTDLIHWMAIWESAVVASDTVMQFADPSSPYLPSRFYRLVQH